MIWAPIHMLAFIPNRVPAFISFPFQSNPELNRVRVYPFAEFAWKQAFLPVVPHWMFPYLKEDFHRDEILRCCKILLRTCKELWICGDIVTEGMALEIEEAKKVRISISRCLYQTDMDRHCIFPFKEE